MEHNMFIHILFMLVIAIVSIAVLGRLGLPAILAYLLTGVISGPSGLHWFTQQQVHFVAELGVVLLMFTLGLEFSVPRLWSMRRTVFGLGSAQVIVTTFIAGGIAYFLGQNLVAAVVIGSAIALSSTAIVLKLMNEQGWLRRRHGELSISVLLFQDLAVVPMLILLPLLASDGTPMSLNGIFYGLLTGILAFLGLMSFGKWVLPRIFDEVARSRSNELFVLSTLVVALVTGAFTQWLGLSMALGAFIAGMLLGESQYRRQLEADIRPFRDLLMGLFFISIGMLLDFNLVLQYWWQILVTLIAVVVLKIVIVYGLLKLAGEHAKVALSTAISLGQVGEFSFVLLALAVNYQLLDKEVSTILVAVAVISMSLSPWLIRNSVDIAKKFKGGKPSKEMADQTVVLPTSEDDDFVVILGYGRVGQTIARFLKTEAINYIVLDLDPTRVTESRAAGEPVYFGDACKMGILKRVGIRQASMVVVTFAEERQTEEALALSRKLAPDAKILVRTRDDSNLTELKEAGATQVIPESLEGSLMLVSQVLYKCGVPLARIIKRLESERRNHYQYLHGFFSGTETDFTLDLLHAVSLSTSASSVGKKVADIPWLQLDVELRAVRRKGAEIEPAPDDWVLRRNDILMLVGKPRSIEKAEEYLLQG
ncbi:monovalent cation:proton antiporter-2 (CPA2) family protein [Shewanella sp. ULN5]|uniref:monovalent cation:proton antiporter-2 (CPA2) family protein n=1 Tax=Shewanella sp. ULN5 TaxID=2994678 RepID=UPI00273F7220|nr:monovalent cation:proton antiporter-2 (CPA2) family protein [Shewanella sp. ULN5]MDP5146747.1 monovalent cation:proton antiporter-2 (CPA2) family protein [Shewanella sp. ULN5]